MKLNWYTSNRGDIAFKAVNNMLNGNANPVAITHMTRQFKSLYDGAGIWDELINPDLNSMLQSGMIVALFDQGKYFVENGSDWRDDSKCGDLILLQKVGNDLKLVAYTANSKEKIVSAVLRYEAVRVGNLITSYFINEGYETQFDDVQVMAISSDGFYVPVECEVEEKPPEWTFKQVVELNVLTSQTKQATIESQQKAETITKQENKIMSKVTAIVASNKAAALNAAKLTAGEIALKQLTKAASKALPNSMAGMFIKQNIDTPLGRVVLANLLNVGVEQYAPNNQKAKIVADAAMNAAMLELVKSFNIAKLVDDLVSGIDITGITQAQESED